MFGWLVVGVWWSKWWWWIFDGGGEAMVWVFGGCAVVVGVSVNVLKTSLNRPVKLDAESFAGTNHTGKM
ncbi:hypothetical protein HanHA300_Chr09g0303551 [Helianthus annuus]|nr:hypothetical protein HanHA300_Chr09g0303551 [Helianthus annuus]KAJ0706087.1 hypothetical protein HanLR1_Chr09g0303011 [Helianthus annuus]